MARTNVATRTKLTTHEDGTAHRISPLLELRRSVLTCLLFENTFYESGFSIAERIAELCTKVDPRDVAQLALDARDKMHLRHVPLFLLVQISKREKTGPLLAAILPLVIQRADELSEFVSIYWKYGSRDGKSGKHPLSAGIKRGLAEAFKKFNAYSLAKYNSKDAAIKLRDVLFLVHPKPSEELADVWRKLANKQLESPDTWEVALSAGADKKETFERLMTEGKLGGLATLRNLRKMIEVGCDEKIIRNRLAEGCEKALPFRFIAAARHAPRLEDAIEEAMFLAVADIQRLPGRTGLLVDVSGSMDYQMSGKSEITRLEAAAGLAILLREKAELFRVATFSASVVEVPPRRGFALRDAIFKSQAHLGTQLKAAVDTLRKQWLDVDRFVIITDEQSSDGNSAGFAARNYLVNVASYQNGVSYNKGYCHIDGFSEAIFDFIAAYEREDFPSDK